MSYGEAAVKMVPLLLGQSRGAEAPRGGVMEISVAVGATDLLLEVRQRVVELLGTGFVDRVLLCTVGGELVDCGKLDTVALLVPMAIPSANGGRVLMRILEVSMQLTLLFIVLRNHNSGNDSNNDYDD